MHENQLIAEKRIAALQETYDSLVARRARIIAVYDRASDGSREKAMAQRGLETLNDRIRSVEHELAYLTAPLT